MTNCGNATLEVKPFPVLFWSILSLETCVIVGGNLLLVLLFFRSRSLRTKQNYFVLSLSISDLLVGLSVPPCEYCAYARTPPCQMFCGSVISFNMVGTIMNLILIAGDRYASISRPFDYHSFLTKKRALLMIVFGWMTAFVLILLPFSWIVNESVGKETKNVINLCYTGCMFILTISVGVGLAICYYRIVRLVREKLSGEKANNPAGIRVCIIVAIIFFICWLPTSVAEILTQIDYNFLGETAQFTSYCVLLLNPCLDPIMYAYYRSDFRRQIVRLFKPSQSIKLKARKCSKKHSNNSNSRSNNSEKNSRSNNSERNSRSNNKNGATRDSVKQSTHENTNSTSV